MATWFEIIYTGEPTKADYARVAELAAQGYTSGQLINDPDPADLIRAARSWAADCEWLDGEDIADMSDAQVVAGVEAHYDGGWAAFAAAESIWGPSRRYPAMPHDHGPALSEDAFSPEAEACPFILTDLPCGCQDVHYACGYTDREHDHVECPG